MHCFYWKNKNAIFLLRYIDAVIYSINVFSLFIDSESINARPFQP